MLLESQTEQLLSPDGASILSTQMTNMKESHSNGTHKFQNEYSQDGSSNAANLKRKKKKNKKKKNGGG